MKTIDTLVSDIESLFDGHHFDYSVASRFSSAVANNLVDRFKEYGEDRKPTLRLSNIGKPLRQLWFELKSGAQPEPLKPSDKLKFLYGDILEDTLLLLVIAAGHEVTDIQKRVEIDGIIGHIDCIIDGWVIDFKSCSPASFKKFKTNSLREDDPFGYVAQLLGYGSAINLPSAYLAIDKVHGNLHLLKLDGDYDVKQRIVDCRTALDKAEPPVDLCYEPEPFGKSGNLALPIGCSFCKWKHPCYKDKGIELRQYQYSFGPVYFTEVKREPRVTKGDHN